MNQITIFQNKDFGEVRTIEVDNVPMICLADVCKILELTNPSRVRTRLKEDGITTSEVTDNYGRKQTAIFINENNLYKVIFQSRKPEAEKFTEWVTTEVLPTIRRTGMYATADLLDNPDLAIETFKQLKAEREKRKLLESHIEDQKPKVLFADTVETSNSTILVGDLAKIIKQAGYDIGQKRLFSWLRDNGYLMKHGDSYNMPTQKAMDLKLFEIQERSIISPHGNPKLIRTTKVTGKGQIYFLNKLADERGVADDI